MNLIKLDYAVLTILANGDASGYDVTARLRDIWKTTHSRIYPVLAKLEKLEMVNYTHVEQSNKPDKKIYCITPSGTEALKKWVVSKTSQTVKKDEGLLKVMCLHLLDRDVTEKLINERITEIEKDKKKLEALFNNFRKESGGVITNTKSKYFNAHVVSEATQVMQAIEMAWAHWVIELYRKETAENFYNFSFVDYLEEVRKNK